MWAGLRTRSRLGYRARAGLVVQCCHAPLAERIRMRVHISIDIREKMIRSWKTREGERERKTGGAYNTRYGCLLCNELPLRSHFT